MQSFDQYVDSTIALQFKELNEKRAKLSTIKKRKLKAFNIIVTIVTGVASIYAWYYFGSFWVFFGAVFTVFIAMMLFQEQITDFLLKGDGLREMKRGFKEKVIKPIVHYFGSDWNYAATGKLSREELIASHLFHLGSNTRVETDDIIKGKWHDRELLIANVKTTSVSSSDTASRRTESGQSFNGLLVKCTIPFPGKAFIVPKAKTAAGIGGLAGMKFMRDKSMTMQEQRAHNLQALAEGTGGYSWHTGLTTFSKELTKYEVSAEGRKDYLFYTDTKTVYDQLINNDKLTALQLKSFVDKGAVDELSKARSFQLLDNGLMDNIVQSTITYAIHSGHVWVLIPAFEDKFELNLDREINKETVSKTYRDISLALASLAPFID